MSGRVLDLTLSEAGHRLLRYRPVVIAALVTLTLLRALPHPAPPSPTVPPAASGAVITEPPPGD